MANNRYTVEMIDPKTRETVRLAPFSTSKEAKDKAKNWFFRYPGTWIYISFFRPRDGQKGYINPDGPDINGKDWSEFFQARYKHLDV